MDSDGEDDIQRKYHGANDGWQQQAGQRLPFGRLIDPAEVARAIAFLASVESGLMTGSVINFDQTVWGACDGNPAPTQPLQD
jgi:NAD(P)-dependent dehydrogenase (short-subunit alcohol dehydrogenase family)